MPRRSTVTVGALKLAALAQGKGSAFHPCDCGCTAPPPVSGRRAAAAEAIIAGHPAAFLCVDCAKGWETAWTEAREGHGLKRAQRAAA